MRRREFIAGLGVTALWPVTTRGQQTNRRPVIGILGTTSALAWEPWINALKRRLAELGWVEGRNIAIEYRWAEGQYARLPGLAGELLQAKIDLMVTHGTPGTLAAKRATTTVPIVMAISGDAVATDLVASIARPGGNIT